MVSTIIIILFFFVCDTKGDQCTVPNPNVHDCQAEKSETAHGHTAVVLLNIGGPDSVEAIQPFLENLFSDPDILKFPLSWILQKPLAKFISWRRSKKVTPSYEKLGGKSPLGEITKNQAIALQETLGKDFSVHVSMRYWHPRAEEAVERIKFLIPQKIVLLPLYPHYCRATTGSSLKDIEKALEKGGLGEIERVVIQSWENFGPYISALSECIEEVLGENSVIVFSAHSIPMSVIEDGDPYFEHVNETVFEIMKNFPNNQFRLSFQSRAGWVRWLGPSTKEVMENLASEGVEDITVVPVSFVSDHIETLCEIDEEYREISEKIGIKTFTRVPSLNVRSSFILALKELVIQRLSESSECCTEFEKT